MIPHNEVPYTITNESITVVWAGKPVVVRKGSPNFVGLRKALFDGDLEKIKNNLTISKGIKEWAKGLFSVEGERILYDGKEIPVELNRRVIELASLGEDPTAILNFWERLQRNPSYRSVEQLWDFLSHQSIPLTEDGCFMAYKGVNDDMTDCHTSTFSNKPGSIHKMPRNEISDDPRKSCHVGFHVGAIEYARGFGSKTVVCKVDPEHVVCVPYDSSQQKMRVCEYEVVGNYGADLASTLYEDEKLGEENGPDAPAAPETPPPVERPTPPKAAYDASKKDKKKPKKKKKTKTERKPAPGWGKFNRMDIEKLMKQQIGILRKYAAHGCLIAGASKIPGGKVALVSAIMKSRK